MRYCRIALPAHQSGLQHFVHPSTVDHKAVFSVTTIPDENVPISLRRSSLHVTKQVSKLYGKKKMLAKLVVDFEACVDVSGAQATAQPVASTLPHTIPDMETSGIKVMYRYAANYLCTLVRARCSAAVCLSDVSPDACAATLPLTSRALKHALQGAAYC
jgi:hypothetical protein